MYRGYKDYDGVERTHCWGHTDHSATGYSDHVRRPVSVDTDGRKHPIKYPSGTEGYVIKEERIVEHFTRVAPVTEYRYSSDEPLADHRRHGQLGPVYDHPENVGEFLIKVQNEANRPVTKVSFPFGPNWHAQPNSAGKYHDIASKNYADESNDFQDKQNEGYPEFYKGTNPAINNKDMYHERPGSKYGPAAPNHPLSKPTNNSDTVVDSLTQAMKPNYGTNTQTDVSRPPKAGPLSSVNWRTGLNSAAQDRKLDSGDDDWAKPKEQSKYGGDKNEKFPEPTSPINNKEGYRRADDNGSPMYFGKPASFPATSQQPPFTTPTMQNREANSSPQPVIDSSEARKRYGKLKSQSVPEDEYRGKIDSDTAAKKYNGAKVPW